MTSNTVIKLRTELEKRKEARQMYLKKAQQEEEAIRQTEEKLLGAENREIIGMLRAENLGLEETAQVLKLIREEFPQMLPGSGRFEETKKRGRRPVKAETTETEREEADANEAE